MQQRQWKAEDLERMQSSSSVSEVTSSIETSKSTKAENVSFYVVPTERLRVDSRIIDYSPYEKVSSAIFFIEPIYAYTISIPNPDLKPVGKINIFYHEHISKYHPRDITAPFKWDRVIGPEEYQAVATLENPILQDLISFLTSCCIIMRINENRNLSYFIYDIAIPQVIIESLATDYGIIQIEINKKIVHMVNNLFYRKFNYKYMEFQYEYASEITSVPIIHRMKPMCFNLLECYRSRYLNVTVIKEIYKVGHR